MSKIHDLIAQTQAQIEEKTKQHQELVQALEKGQQQLQQLANEYNALIARLNTLQEVANAGADLFQSEEVGKDHA